MPDLVLGTAQLGMNYGINNEDGKPSKTESFKILDYAYNENIKMVDTALAYGDSEKVIGDYKNSFKICSKMPSLSNMNNGDIEKTFNKSLNNLKVETIDYYLIHDFQDALKQDVIHFLKKYKKEGIINNTGVSVYEPEEADKIINTGLYDSIQIPLNILDTRFLQKGLLSNKNITIFIRSIFLQGLLFLDYDKTPENLSEASSYLKKINDFCDDHNVNLVNLIFTLMRIK